ncbi:MAG: phosphatase PAP2 family protein [Alphaproteobacteria bacterium]|nr:phosphatase PAP2 family protein [Alphaproteobacteria bacterium]
MTAPFGLPRKEGTSTNKFYAKLLAAFLTAALALAVFPQVDLSVSRLFYAPSSGFVHSDIFDFLRHGLPYLIAAALAVALLLEVKGLAPRRAFLFVAASYALGPGLLVNGILKEFSGRARPAQIAQFGGLSHFTPAFIFTNQCAHNCSFTAGDPSVGFALIAFAFLFPRFRLPLTFLALFVGCGFGIIRIMQGGHFLSDVCATAFVTIASVMILYKFCIKPFDSPPALR